MTMRIPFLFSDLLQSIDNEIVYVNESAELKVPDPDDSDENNDDEEEVVVAFDSDDAEIKNG